MSARGGDFTACPSLGGRSFGQTEPPLWEFIKGVLDRYPEGGQILKELVQNADDAGATEVNFLLDGRPSENEPSNFQGPALYAQNNALFKDDDWKSIQSPCRSIKKDDPLKIGKFGIGFNSVYHLTDLPTIVSGDKIGFLDPHKRLWFGESGHSFSLEESREPKNRSYFESLNVLGCNVFESTDYQGTLFRFPLRQNRLYSKISSSVWDADRVLKVLFESFRVDAHLILLFLKSVESVSLYQWLPGTEHPQPVFTTCISSNTLFEVRASRRELLESARRVALASGSEIVEKRFCMGVTCRFASKFRVAQDWIVFHRIDNSNADVQIMAADLHLTPWIGLALPLGQRTEHASKLGRIFCFLPLPPSEDDSSETGLPVHIHGFFSVADDRRSLTWPAKDRECDSKAMWNYLLLKDILPLAYSGLICNCTGLSDTATSRLERLALQDVYSAWPDPQRVRDHWRQIALPAFLALLTTNRVLYTEALGGQWVRPDKAVICLQSANKSELAVRKQMISLGYFIVVVPRNVDQCLATISRLDVKRMNPAYVRKALRGSTRDRHRAVSNTRADQLELLRYILLDDVYSELPGLKLLPVADDSFETFERPASSTNLVYISSQENPLSLFPGLKKIFVDPSIDKDIMNKLASFEMEKATQIQALSRAEVPRLIKRMLPQQRSLQISWLPSYRERHPSVDWMAELWKWLSRHPHMLSDFVSCHLIPCNSNKCLVQLSQDMPVIFRQFPGVDVQLDDKVARGLLDLGCVVVNNTPRYVIAHPNITVYVLPPSRVLTCLARLPSLSSYVLAMLSPQASRSLLRLLSAVMGYHKPTREEEDILCRLPLFYLRGSLKLTSVRECPDIAPSPGELPDDFPLKKKIIKHPEPEEEIVLRRIPQSNYRYLSFNDIVLRLVFPSFSSYSPKERTKLAKHILLHRPHICKPLESLEFVPVSYGHVMSPAEVFSSANELVRRLFKGKPLFSTDRDLETLIHNSPVVSFRSISSVTPSELITVAKEAGKGDVEKGKALLQLIVDESWAKSTLEETAFVSSYRAVSLATALSDIPWLPCLADPPHRYPKSVTWKATNRISKPSETLYAKPESQDVVYNITGSQLVFLNFPGIVDDELVQLLGFVTLQYHTVLQHLSMAMQCWKEGRVPGNENELFGEMMCNLIRVLGFWHSDSKPPSLFLQLQQWTQQSVDWIWLDSKRGFVKISQLAKETNEWRLEDWRFSVADFAHLRECVPLFLDLGMKGSWDETDLISLLVDVKAFHSTHRPAVTKQRVEWDLQLSLNVLNLLTKDEDVLPVSKHREILVPVEGPDDKLELALTSTVTYGDAKYLRNVDKHGLGAVKLIHHRVPHSTAFALGVPFVVHHLAPSEELDFEVEEFGQHEPLTVRLNNILKEYTDDSSIFKELIQNADDAGATEVKFLVDWRKHRCSTLLSTGMAACQGPALLAYNNALFTEEDFVSISRLAAGTKRKRLDKIGRFGVGFSSVYHLTEVPSFVSGEHVVIFDPAQNHLGRYIRNPNKPGAKINFIKNPVFDRFPDQFMPYVGLFGVNKHTAKPYQGTLFRFPFRTRDQAKISKIKNEQWNEKRVKQLIRELELIAKKVLIFLTNVRSVKLFELQANAKGHAHAAMTLLSSVESKQLKVERMSYRSSREDIVKQCQIMMSQSAQFCDKALLSDPALHATAAVIEITSQQSGKSSHCQYFLVCSSIGTEQAMEIACSPSGKEAGCMPLASVAIQLQRSREVFVPAQTEGELFCVLPLSELTGLPFHVSGMFSVLSNRRSLWWYNSEEADAERKDRSLHPKWNEALITDAVATAAIRAIETLQQVIGKACSREDFYKIWPKSEGACHPMWKQLVSKFYSLISDDLPLFCTVRTPPTWLPLSDCLFLSPSVKALPHAFSICTQLQDNFVEAPEHVLDGLTSAKRTLMEQLTWNQIEFIRKVFEHQTRTTALKSRQRDDLISKLLERVISGSISKELLGVLEATGFVPSSPDGFILRRPKELIDPTRLSGKLYVPRDGRFPWSGICGRHTNGEKMLLALKTLGMRSMDELTWDDCMERAKTVDQLFREDPSSGLNRVKALLKLVTILEDRDPPEQVEHIQIQLRKIPFLPAMKRPKGYPLATWHADSCSAVVESAENMFAHTLSNVIGSQSLVLASPLNLPRTLCIQEQPRLDIILQQLDLVLQTIDKAGNIVPKELANMIFSTYSVLEERLQCDPGGVEEVLMKYLGERPWLYLKYRLVKPCQLAFHCTIRAPPYLYEVTGDLNKFPLLLKTAGVRPQFSCKDYVCALQLMMQDSSDRRLGEEMVSCALQILNGFADMDKTKLSELREAVVIPVLSKDCCLLPSTDLAYNDAQWISDSLTKDDKLMFVHDKIARSLAVDLGVPPVRHKMLNKYASDIPGEPFGQSEELTQRLSNILKDYPWGEGILKELLQNADDAGATMLHIIYDRRQHGQKSVFNTEWENMQGPAICVYNNRVFTKKDIEGIQNLGRGSKRDDPSLIGQYGIGFNAVYHLTDCPTLVSNDETLCVFDPHCLYVPGATKKRPGRQFDLCGTFWQEFSDIAHTYKSLPDVTLSNGTLFRFPLRTVSVAKISKISNVFETEEKILHLFEKFREEAADMLLFLNHVCSIKLSTVNPDGSIADRFEVVATLDSAAAQKRRELASAVASSLSVLPHIVPFKNASYTMTIQVSPEDKRKPQSEKSFRRWLVYQCIGSPCPDSFTGESQLALLPRAGIAAPVDDRLECSKSRVFCFLPLPNTVKSRLPVYVNGHFALDSSRRSLYEDTSRANNRRPTERQGWNEDLVKFVLAPAYCHFLLEARKLVLKPTEDSSDRRLKQLDSQIRWYNHLFPNYNARLDNYWAILSREVFCLILNQHLALFPYVGCPLPSDRPVLKQDEEPSVAQCLEKFDKSHYCGTSSLAWKAVEPPNSLGLHQSYFFCGITVTSPTPENKAVHNYILRSILLRIGVPIVASDSHIRLCMMKAAEKSLQEQKQACVQAVQKEPQLQPVSVQETTSQVVLLFLRHYRKPQVRCSLSQGHVTSTVLRNVDNVTELLRYVLSEENVCHADLEGVPLLLTEDCYLRIFSSQSPAYVSEYSSLLPRQQSLFVHSAIGDCFLPLSPESKVVRQFSPDQLVHHLAGSGIYDAKWEYTDHYMEWQEYTSEKLPTKQWIKTLWRYLKSAEGSCDDALEALKQWPVVPAQQHSQALLVPVSLVSSLFCFGLSNYTPDHDSDMEEHLRNLGATEIDVDLMEETEERPKTIAGRTLHSLLKGRVAVLRDHISVLTALDCFYKTFRQPTELEAADRFLKYFETALSTIRRQRLLPKLGRLPLFETADGRLSSVASRDCYVVPNDIVTAGSNIWMKRPSRVFLKCKPKLNSLYEALQLNDKTCQEVYTDCILPCFPKMDVAIRLQHLAFIGDCHQQRIWSTVVDKLKCTPCFEQSGTLQPVSSFFDPTVPLFHLMLTDEDFPPPFGNNDEGWLPFLRVLGLKTVCPSSLFEHLAQELHKDAHSWTNPTKAGFPEWKMKSEEMVRHLFQNIKEYKSGLTALGKIEFLECRRVDSSLSRLAIPFYERGPVSNYATSFERSVRPSKENEQLCWISAPLLPDYECFSNADTYFDDLGSKSEPDLQSVLDNFEFLTRELHQSNLTDDRDIPTVKEVVSRIFGYLATKGQPTVENVCSRLRGCPCIFLPSRKIFVGPQQVVMSVTEEIWPYLVQLPEYLQMHGHFLVHLGVANRATPNHYIHILKKIRECHLTRSPERNEHFAIVAAVRCFFRSLKVSVELNTTVMSNTDAQQETAVTEREDLISPDIPLYLPDRQMQLLVSSSLVYLDKPEFQSYVKYLDRHFLLDLKQCDLPPLKEKTIGLLPKTHRPVCFSEIAEKTLDTACTVDDVEDALLSEIEVTYVNLLSSKYFIQALHSIYTHQNRNEELPVCVKQGLTILQSSLRVKCLAEIRTQLQLIESSRVVDGTSRKTPCFLEKRGNAATLYLSKDDVLATGQQQRQLILFQLIAKELENLLEAPLYQSALMILLASTDPSTIPHALADLGVEYIGGETNARRPIVLEEEDLGEVKPGMSLRSDHMQLIRFAPVEDSFSPKDLVAYQLKENHFVYALVMCRVYSDADTESTDNRSELQSSYVINIGGEKTIAVGMLELYAFKSAVTDQESTENQAVVVSQSMQQQDETIEAVSRQLQQIKKLPPPERRKAAERLYMQWYLSEADSPEAREVFDIVKKGIQMLEHEGPEMDADEELFPSWNSRVQSYRLPSRACVVRDPPRLALTFPEPEKGRMFVAQALVDLKVAETLFKAASSDKQLYAAVCFHCHEAVEKALKGAMFYTEGIDGCGQKCHLIRYFLHAGEFSESLRRQALVVDNDYLKTRYPDQYCPCRVPADCYHCSSAVRSLDAAREVVRHAAGTCDRDGTLMGLLELLVDSRP